MLPGLLKRVAHLVGHRPGLRQQVRRRGRPMWHQVAEAQELQAVRLGPAVAAGPGKFQARLEQQAARAGVDHERGRGEYVPASPLGGFIPGLDRLLERDVRLGGRPVKIEGVEAVIGTGPPRAGPQRRRRGRVSGEHAHGVVRALGRVAPLGPEERQGGHQAKAVVVRIRRVGRVVERSTDVG